MWLDWTAFQRFGICPLRLVAIDLAMCLMESAELVRSHVKLVFPAVQGRNLSRPAAAGQSQLFESVQDFLTAQRFGSQIFLCEAFDLRRLGFGIDAGFISELVSLALQFGIKHGCAERFGFE